MKSSEITPDDANCGDFREEEQLTDIGFQQRLFDFGEHDPEAGGLSPPEGCCCDLERLELQVGGATGSADNEVGSENAGAAPTHSAAHDRRVTNVCRELDLESLYDQEKVSGGLDKEFFSGRPCSTPEIDLACRRLIHWIRTDNPGAVMSGGWRNGKSMFCDYMHENIALLMGGSTLSVRWSTLKINQHRDLDWLRDRLRQSGCDGFNHNSRAILMHRLRDGLKRRAKAAGARRILFLVDEAQLTSEAQLGYLGDVHNELSTEFGVFIFLAGQPELSQLSAGLRTTDARNTAARFFNLRHHFNGIRLDQLEEVLNSLDMASDSSVVGRHFPSLAARGWQLGDAAEAIKEAFSSVREQLNLWKVIRLPMELIRAIANDLLYRMDIQRHDPLSAVCPASVLDYLNNTSWGTSLHLYQTEVEPSSVVDEGHE